MRVQNVYAFAQDLKLAGGLPQCAERFLQEVTPFGFNTFACGEVDLQRKERTTFLLMHWPEDWRRFYLESGLINRDPVIEALSYREEPFTWDDLRLDRRLAAVGGEALDKIISNGWSSGLIVPIALSPHRKAIISLVGRGKSLSDEQQAYLFAISVLLYQHVRGLVGIEGFAMPPGGLTRRELSVVKLVAVGKTDKEIADALAIAPSTAHEHVENAKRRLSVHSRAELAAIATQLAIVSV